MIDYKELLIKYIEHVGNCEGTDYIPKILGEPNKFGIFRTKDPFTTEEIEALWECSGWDESTREYKACSK